MEFLLCFLFADDNNSRTTSPSKYPPIVIKKPAPLEKQTPNYLSAFSNFVKQGEDKGRSGPASAPKPKLYTSGPKVPVIGSPYRPPFEDSPKPYSKGKSEKTPTQPTSLNINITPGLEDLVSKEIESKIFMEKVQANEPKPIPKNTYTYKVVSQLVQQPDTLRKVYQNLTRQPKVVEIVTPVPGNTSSTAILLSNSTVRAATTQADQRSQQMQRVYQQVSHLNIKQYQPKPAPAPHADILKPYYADKTTPFVDKNGRVIAYGDSIVQATPQTAIYVGQKPVLF